MKPIIIVATILLWSVNTLAQYDKVDSLIGGMAMVTKGKKVGFINAQKKLVIPLAYDYAFDFSEGLAMVRSDGKAGYVSATNTIVVPIIYDDASDFRKGSARVGIDKKYWLINKNGKQITVRKYDLLKRDGDYSLVSLDKKWGSIDYAGQEIIAPEYDELLYKTEGLLAAKKDRRWGFIDSLDQVVLPFIYRDANRFEDGFAIVRNEDYDYGTINKNGKNIISFQYDNLYKDNVTGGLWAQKKEKWGMVNLKGKELIPFKFDVVQNFTMMNEAYAVVEIMKKKGLIDRKGQLLIPAMYDEIYGCMNGYCGVGLNSKIGMVELKTGKEVIRPQYDDIGFFQSGLAMVMKKGSYANPNDKTYERCGFVNTEGTQIVPLNYYEVRNFVEGMAAVRVSAKWGFVDSTGKEVIFPRYDEVSDFEKGKATVISDEGEFYIDKKGRLSVKPPGVKVKDDAPNAKPLSDDMYSFEDVFNFSSTNADSISSTGANFQTYSKTNNPTPQMILRTPEFPSTTIMEKGKLGYHIVDVSQESFGKENWLVTLSKNTLGVQTVYLLDDLSKVPVAAKQVAEKYPGYEMTHISFTHKKWVVVFSQYPPGSGYRLFNSTATSGTDFPRKEIKENFDAGFLIKRMAYGEGGWAILFTKDTANHGQSVRGWAVVDKAEIDSMKKEGFFLSNLIKAQNIHYASFYKLNGKTIWYYQQYRTKPKPSPEELLEQGYTLYRNFYIPDK